MSKDNTKWHRLLVMVSMPLYEILGFETQAEVDLSLKKQLVDLLVIKKKKENINYSALPKIFWEAFDNLNNYNLITFKTYSESLNSAAIEEFYGHFTNYLKINKINRNDVNLYAITQHFPDKILKPFKNTNYLK